MLLFVLLFLFKKLEFYFFIEVPSGGYADFSSTFGGIIIWSSALIFGPTVLWLAVIGYVIDFARSWQREDSKTVRWNSIRNSTLNITGSTLISLTALTLYQRLDGVFPLPGLTINAVLPAFYATLVTFLLSLLIYAPLVIYVIYITKNVPDHPQDRAWPRIITIGLITVIGSSFLVDLYAILGAGLYTQIDPQVYFFFISGTLIMSWLAHRLSQAVESSQLRSRELAKLEALGRAILAAPADASTLPEILQEHASDMFARCHIEIRMDQKPLFPTQSILHYPEFRPPVGAAVWDWQRANLNTRQFPPKTKLPWGEQLDADTAVVLAPILDAENSKYIGGIYLSRHQAPDAITHMIPGLQSLAAQIASALHRAEVFKIEQEMAVAGKIQASFLPDRTPEIPGWELAVVLEPARETSGDFYDFIPLPDGRLGILIADVADKGTGAALYMAASRTLIRTFAAEYATQPELALGAANRHLLADTRADLFVSVFYGILDSTNSTMTYCNAGHNPPYLISNQDDVKTQALTRTGMVLGAIEGETWEQRTIKLGVGDLLVLYTDGVTDANDGQGVFFGEKRLLDTVLAHRKRSTQEIQDSLMAEIHKFVGDAPRFDDITLMILKAEK